MKCVRSMRAIAMILFLITACAQGGVRSENSVKKRLLFLPVDFYEKTVVGDEAMGVIVREFRMNAFSVVIDHNKVSSLRDMISMNRGYNSPSQLRLLAMVMGDRYGIDFMVSLKARKVGTKTEIVVELIPSIKDAPVITEKGFVADRRDVSMASISIARSLMERTNLVSTSIQYWEVKTAVVGGIDLVYVPGGKFVTGKHTGSRVVSIDGFWMGKYGITRGQFLKFVYKDNKQRVHDKPSNGDGVQVSDVSWYDTVRFCNYLSESCGYTPWYLLFGGSKRPAVVLKPWASGFRLPTADEWEYACDAGGMKNHYGLYNMAGSPDEWCWDWANGKSEYGKVTRAANEYRCDYGFGKNPEFGRAGFRIVIQDVMR